MRAAMCACMYEKFIFITRLRKATLVIKPRCQLDVEVLAVGVVAPSPTHFLTIGLYCQRCLQPCEVWGIGCEPGGVRLSWTHRVTNTGELELVPPFVLANRPL